jgi:hypothetical protein
VTTNRRTIRRVGRVRLTPETIAAWHACDSVALHAALGLSCMHASPLPGAITALGVDEGDDASDGTAWAETIPQALKLQKALIEAAGWPEDRRAVYGERLAAAQAEVRYAASLVLHPDRGGQGTRCDPVSRQQDLKEARGKVAYWNQLLADLEQHATELK